METNPRPFIPSGTGNISPTQAEWRGLRPNTAVAVPGEGAVVKNSAGGWRPRRQRRNRAEGQRLRSAAVQDHLSANDWRPDAARALLAWRRARAGRGWDAAGGRHSGARRRPGRVLGPEAPACPSGQADVEGDGDTAPPPTRPLGGAAITLWPEHRLLLRRARIPSPATLRTAPAWEPLIGRRGGRAASSPVADWTPGLRAAPGLLGLACCALAQRKRRPAEGALLLGLDGRGGSDEGSGAGGLARAAAVAAADGNGTARRAHGTPRQGRRYLRLVGPGAGAQGARWAAAGAAAAPGEQRVGARRRGLGLGGQRKAGAARLLQRRYLGLPPARRKPPEEAAA